MASLTRFIDLFAASIQTRREIDVETKILIHNMLDETMKQFKKTNVKDKTLNKNMMQNEKQRHFKFDGEKFKGTNGKFLRVAINKVTKIVRRVKPINWTTEAKLKFYEKFPDLIDTEKPKQKKAKKEKKPKKMKAEIKTMELKKEVEQEVKKEVKNKPKKKKISTFDLIASLVEQANSSLKEKFETKNDEIQEIITPKITEKEKKEIKETISQKIQFKTTTQPQQKKKKKVTRNKKKEKKSNLKEIKVKEFTHDDLKETQYIDEHNNIWNDIHKQIGYYDKDTDTVTLLS